METFILKTGKQFLHKLKIIHTKLCKCIHPDKEGGVAICCEVESDGLTEATEGFVMEKVSSDCDTYAEVVRHPAHNIFLMLEFYKLVIVGRR